MAGRQHGCVHEARGTLERRQAGRHKSSAVCVFRHSPAHKAACLYIWRKKNHSSQAPASSHFCLAFSQEGEGGSLPLSQQLKNLGRHGKSLSINRRGKRKKNRLELLSSLSPCLSEKEEAGRHGGRGLGCVALISEKGFQTCLSLAAGAWGQSLCSVYSLSYISHGVKNIFTGKT